MSTLPGNSTIDSTDDGGPLNTARRFNAEVPTHGNIATCVANLNSANKTKTILGHGSKGRIITGTGQSANDASKYISLWNGPSWRSKVKEIENCSNLYLYACHVGASAEGADFLFSLAKTMNTQVLGATGFLFINNKTGAFTLETGSKWQSATPTTRPTPVDPPSPNLWGPEAMQEIALMTETGFQLFAASSIIQLEILRIDSGPSIAAALKPKSITVDNVVAQSFIEFIAFDRPFTPPGSPFAIISAEINLTFDDGTIREFLVLNGLIIQDKKFPDVFYYCRPGFDGMLS